MAEVQWFVILQGKKKGPFTLPELLRLKGVSLNTWVWREGMDKWERIRKIPELKIFFKESDSQGISPLPSEEKFSPKKMGEEVTLSLSNAEPPWIFWLIFLLLIGAYAIWQFYFTS